MTDIFKEYRFNEKHHLGLGDIRLTIAQQNEINDATQALLRVARAAKAVSNIHRKGYLGSGMDYAITSMNEALKELPEGLL